jgi:hypothetical protein
MLWIVGCSHVISATNLSELQVLLLLPSLTTDAHTTQLYTLLTAIALLKTPELLTCTLLHADVHYCCCTLLAILLVSQPVGGNEKRTTCIAHIQSSVSKSQLYQLSDYEYSFKHCSYVTA